MTADECRVADWYLLGELDARAGLGPAQFANRDRDCREAGFPADQTSWRAGWDHGLTVFCTPGQGFRFGREGGRYDSICPAALEPEFLRGFDVGRRIHEQEGRVSSVRGELSSLEARLERERDRGRLSEEELTELQQSRTRLRRQLRQEELALAEVTGFARGLGFL
ncbi:MAG: DUF2799 domain-containing protein [Wenzhouxiangella sp.]